MSIQEILQILGGIGVIASIIFAGLQIRRNTITMRAAANHNINLTLTNMCSHLQKMLTQWNWHCAGAKSSTA